MQNAPWSEWTATLDQWIRSGQSRLATRALKARIFDRSHSPIPRAELPAVAALCRRVGEAESAIRLLNPVVRPRSRVVNEASTAERLEYGAALIQIGASIEGEEILRALNPSQALQAQLFLAFACFGRWDYAGSLPYLERYLASRNISDYQRLVGEVNRVAAWVALDRPDRMEEAHDQILSLRKQARSEGHRLLEGNLTMLLAEVLIARRAWLQADAALVSALRSMQRTKGLDSLLIRKWREVIRLRQFPSDSREMRVIRSEALGLRHWETVRDCDFKIAEAGRSWPLFRHLHWGTPYGAYRERILLSAGEGFEPGGEFTWTPEAAPEDAQDVTITNEIDATTGNRAKANARLKEGQIPQRLLQLLCSNFYRPHRLASIHAELFPERHYNPWTSPDVIHQAIRRLRSHFESRSLPFVVEETQGAYRIRTRLGWGIRLIATGPTAVSEPPRATPEQIRRMRERLTLARTRLASDLPFTRQCLAAALEVSPRTANLILQTAENWGWIEKTSMGRSTAYSLRSEFH